MNITEELRKPEVAAAAGAVAALVAATAIPAAVILMAGAIMVGVVYLYHWKFGGRKGIKGGAEEGEVIDIAPENGGKEK